MKIGDVIYYRYEEGGVLFNERIVVGETSRSWLVKMRGAASWENPLKLPKNMKGFVIGTKDDADLAFWASSNRWKIRRYIDGVDARILLQVAKLVGYQPLPEDSDERP